MLFGRVVAFWIHTLAVYVCALHFVPWLVGRWFAWFVPIIGLSHDIPATYWYLQHLEMVTVIPALVLGYYNLTRLFPSPIRGYIGEVPQGALGTWAWTIPTLILGYKMLLYHAPSSVLFATSSSALRYFFDIQKFMPGPNDFHGSDPNQVLAQMTVTAPFYAGIGYSLGALVSKYHLLQKVFVVEKREEPTDG